MKKVSIRILSFLIGVLSGFLFITPALAQKQSLHSVHQHDIPGQSLPELHSQAAVVMDAVTGTIVFSKNPDDEIPPASLTKLMTMHLALREIEAGRASLDEVIIPTRESWAVNQEPGSSLMYIANGQEPTLRDLLLGMAVISGNDAATAAALRFAPSKKDFVEMMNREAINLGLSKTRFVDAAGYWEHNMTTALEFTLFCRFYLEEHPYALREYHAVREFAYPRAENVPEQFRSNPGTRVRLNTNALLGKAEGVDGLKTGYIPDAGYNIALTAERNNSRFIAVLLGAPSGWGGDRLRDEDGKKIIEWVFANYKTIRLKPPLPEPVRIWKGKVNYMELAWGAPLVFTSRAERAEELSWEIEMTEPLIAPLSAGSAVGTMIFKDSLGELRRIPLLLAGEAESGGFFKRTFDSIRLFFRRFFA
jgi:D-alanyl-D-alanine carboxypeptidase (penicillin-binding protein 5/6)